MKKNEQNKLEDTALNDSNFESGNIANIIKVLEKHMLNYLLKTPELLVALTCDYINTQTKEPYLYCGQVGSVVFLPDPKTCWVQFYDDSKQERKLIHQLELPIIDLLPLFFFSPEHYLTEVNKYREEFANCQKFQFNQTTETRNLQNHLQVSKRFLVNQLVTVGTDFEETVKGDKISVQAGQVGRISETLDNNLVKVIFRSMPFAALIQRIKENHIALDSYWSDWCIEITIQKNYLFPLYYKNLTEGDYYFENFYDYHKDNQTFLDKFDVNYQRELKTWY